MSRFNLLILGNRGCSRGISPGQKPNSKGWVGLVLMLWLVVQGGYAPVAHGQSSAATEYDLKLAFLFNFAKFVEWPSDAFSNDKSPITICVFGADPFGKSLDNIIQGKTADNREFAVRRTNKPEELHGCQIVFISDAERGRFAEGFQGLKHSSVLVVGESDGFAERGGCIQFYLDEKKVRFVINVDAIQRAHLTVSSKLLALARIVHDDGHSKGG